MSAKIKVPQVIGVNEFVKFVLKPKRLGRHWKMIFKIESMKCLFVLMAWFASMLCPALLFAQKDFRPGYIIKNNADTVKGFVAYQSGKKSIEGCVFREARKGATSTYAATEIQGYGILGDRLYQSIELPNESIKNKRVFAKILVQGDLTLYQYNEFFLVERNDTLTVLPKPKEEQVGPQNDLKMKRDSKYIGILNYMLLDCQMNANTASFSEGSLSKAVYKYNQCKKTDIAKQNLRPLAKLDVVIFASYVNSHLTYDHFKFIPFQGNSVAGGGGLEIYSPRVFDRVVFSLETWYNKSFYQGYYEGTFAGDVIREDVFAEFTSLKIPFGIRYNFRSPGNTPYLKFGIYWSSTKSFEVTTIEEREIAGGVLTDEFPGGYDVKNTKGFSLSLGYEKTLVKDTRIFTEFKYERGEGYFGTPVVNDSRMVNYYFLIGLRF